MHVRYDIVTRRVLHLAVSPFTNGPAAGEADAIVPDAPLPGPTERLRLTADLATLEVDPTLAVQRVPVQGLALARTVHLSLDGADASAKFARGLALRGKSLGPVSAFVNDLRLGGNDMGAGALAAAQSSWSAVKNDPLIGVAGSDPAHLTAAEASRVEAAAAVLGVALS